MSTIISQYYDKTSKTAILLTDKYIYEPKLDKECIVYKIQIYLSDQEIITDCTAIFTNNLKSVIGLFINTDINKQGFIEIFYDDTCSAENNIIHFKSGGQLRVDDVYRYLSSFRSIPIAIYPICSKGNATNNTHFLL